MPDIISHPVCKAIMVPAAHLATHGIENLSRCMVNGMAKGLNEQVQSFRDRSVTVEVYPALWVDALHEKVRYAGRVVSMAIQIVCGVNAYPFQRSTNGFAIAS